MSLADYNKMASSVMFVKKMKEKYAREVFKPSDNLDMILRYCACTDEDFFDEEKRKANEFFYRVILKDGKLELSPSYELTILDALEPVDFENTPKSDAFVDGYSVLTTASGFPGKQQVQDSEIADRWDMKYLLEEVVFVEDSCIEKMTPEEMEKYKAHKLCKIGEIYVPLVISDRYERREFYIALDPWFVDNKMPYSMGPACPDRKLSDQTFTNVLRHMMIDMMFIMENNGITHDNIEVFCMAACSALVKAILKNGAEHALSVHPKFSDVLRSAEEIYTEWGEVVRRMDRAADMCYLLMVWNIEYIIEPYDEETYTDFREFIDRPLENREYALAPYMSPQDKYGF